MGLTEPVFLPYTMKVMEGRVGEESKRYYLSQAKLLRDLSAEQMSHVERLGKLEVVPRGKLLYTPGERGAFFILKRGRVQLYRLSPEGRRLLLANLGEGDCFGEMTLFGQGTYDAFAEASQESLVCTFSPEAMEALLERYPKVAQRLLEVMGKRLAEVEGRLEEIAFKSVPSRLSNLLLGLPRNAQGEIVGFSHEQLSEIIGAYRETVTQVLGEFESQGLIKVGRLRIQLLDEARLKRDAPR